MTRFKYLKSYKLTFIATFVLQTYLISSLTEQSMYEGVFYGI